MGFFRIRFVVLGRGLAMLRSGASVAVHKGSLRLRRESLIQRWGIISGRAELVAEASSVHPRHFNAIFYRPPPPSAPPPCGRG